MRKWLAILAVLRLGIALKNRETWKVQQVLVNVIVGLLTAGYFLARAQGWITFEIDDSTLLEVGSAFGAALYSGYNAYLTVATTKTIGLAPVAPATVDAVADVLLEPEGQAVTGPLPSDDNRRPIEKPVTNPFLDG